MTIEDETLKRLREAAYKGDSYPRVKVEDLRAILAANADLVAEQTRLGGVIDMWIGRATKAEAAVAALKAAALPHPHGDQ